MRIARWLTVLALWVPGGLASAQDYAYDGVGEARVWLDRGEEPLLQRGDRLRIYYRTSHDAYVAIFQIDTDGSVRLLHPRGPGDETFTRGGRDYRLLFPQSSYWFVDEYPGKGYFFIVASPEPLDLSAFDYRRFERSWDLTRVGRSVYRDPYLAMDDYVARLVPDWERVPYALDFISYDVGEVHDYPRFLCYDCHGYRSYPSWNPYTYACASFRVVVWDDPYFYPTYRYQAARVVVAAPRRGMARFEFKERAPDETWAPLVRTRQPPLRRSTEYVEPGAAMPLPREWVPPRRPSAAAAPSDRQGRGAQPAEPGRAEPPRAVRPSEPGRAAPSTTPRPTTGQERPTLQRRPSTSTTPPAASGGTRGAVPRPSTRGGTPPPSREPPSAGRPGEGARVVMPPRTGGGSARPSAAPSRPSGSTRPSAAPSRPSGSGRPSAGPSRPPSGGAAKPPPRRKPGGGEG